MRVKILEQPFADKGQKTPVPEKPQADGGLNWQEGFTLPYSKNPESDGKYIEREQFNELLHIITSHQMALQSRVPLDYDDKYAKKVKYRLYQRATIYYNPFNSTLYSDPDLITEGDLAFVEPLVVTSMKKDNVSSPLVFSNLFTDWLVEDGATLGELKFMSINKGAGSAFPAPPGYIELGVHEGDEPTEFEFSKYPRLARLVNENRHPFLKKVSQKEAFTIVDLRGMFPRVFSNGSDKVDTGRQFETLQGDAARVLKGEFMAVDCSKWAKNEDHARRRSFYENSVNINMFYSPLGNEVKLRRFFAQSERNAFTSVRENTVGGADNASPYNLEWNSFIQVGQVKPGAAQKNLLGNKVRLNSADVWPTSTEFRPHNFNIKLYMKA